jgi:hypothetical protein
LAVSPRVHIIVTGMFGIGVAIFRALSGGDHE